MLPPVRHIIHADLDAFYAAVEQLDNPELRGLPVLVGGRPEGRGVVATASYEARRFGVHSAMPMATAVRQCPDGIIVRPRFDRYREMSGLVMDIFRDVTEVIQPVSLDEAYLDVTEAAANRSPIAIAIDIKERVSAETGLTVSVGLGSGKTVAKIASDLQKPDGLVVVPTGEEAYFLASLAVGKLVGVGPKSAARLHDEGVDTIGQLATMPEAWFARHFGKRGDSIRNRARGIDHDPVQTSREAKSISAETTFAEDLPGNSDDERAELMAIVERLSGRVARSLPGKGLVAAPSPSSCASPTSPPSPARPRCRHPPTTKRPSSPPRGCCWNESWLPTAPFASWAWASPASPKRRAPTKRRSPWSPSNG